MYTYSQSISEGSGSTCSLGSQPSDLLCADMYTLCMCRLSFVLVDPVRFFLFLFSLFSFFSRNEFPQTRGFLGIRQS